MPLVPKKMETRRLHNSDMKKLVRILRGTPYPFSSSKDKAYRQNAKESIHSLPRRLRSSHLSFSSSTTTSNLCSTHKGLDANLIAEIYAWLRHELDGAIGKFLYPLIMSGVLTHTQELKMRQLEPARQMWQHDFQADLSAPPGRQAIQCGDKWSYQVDQCAACILARIGSDEGVLFALFAGMVGRMKDKASGMDVLRGIVGMEKVKSKRLRFVRYWVKAASRGGENAVFEAGELGLKMKGLRHEWKVQQRRLRDGKNLQPAPKPNMPRQSHETESAGRLFTDAESVIGIDITVPYQPKEWSPLNAHDPKLGPNPRPSNAIPLSPAALLGFGIPGFRDSDPHSPHAESESKPPLARPPSTSSDTTIHPGSSISVAHLRPPPLRPQKPPKMQEALVEKYRAMLAAHSNAYASHPIYEEEEDGDDDASSGNDLPKPRPTSMYESFGNTGFDDDKFEGVDEEVEEIEEEDGEDVGEWRAPQTPNVATYRRPSVASASTGWDGLY
ncbi:hypothetical protein N0V83_003627 [Neocucurbitaria cava]|uniref:Uncharacterized protein n=1 Tax=Neocucurbitaria cava TaxID=798079 RepID=A0A9W9CNT9_9PLEO|nr:hypothetical protein N0V83_003627 [Neocucurbitaria cava]